MTLLEKIIINKKKEVSGNRKKTRIRELENSLMYSDATLSLSEFIVDPVKTGIIAEYKRKSPSGGIINSNASVEAVTTGYSASGASGLSILTDRLFFGGDCNDLVIARKHHDIPILRKEFIIDEFQVIESKAAGADAILLIASVLEKEQVRNFARLSRSLKMEVLLEIHTPQELDMINEYVNIIGVNNRDLNTLKTDLRVSLDLSDRIPEEFIRISESGISTPEAIADLRSAGYNGFLIGEYFMRDKDPVKAFADFIKRI